MTRIRADALTASIGAELVGLQWLHRGAFRDATTTKTYGAFRDSRTPNALHSTHGASAR